MISFELLLILLIIIVIIYYIIKSNKSMNESFKILSDIEGFDEVEKIDKVENTNNNNLKDKTKILGKRLFYIPSNYSHDINYSSVYKNDNNTQNYEVPKPINYYF